MQNLNIREEGYYHLRPQGWCRKDDRPFPYDRVETWRYEMEQPSPAAKQQVHLTRIWIAKNAPELARRVLHLQFGDAVVPGTEKSILVQCRVWGMAPPYGDNAFRLNESMAATGPDPLSSS